MATGGRNRLQVAIFGGIAKHIDGRPASMSRKQTSTQLDHCSLKLHEGPSRDVRRGSRGF